MRFWFAIKFDLFFVLDEDNFKFDEDNHSFTGVSTAEKNMRKKRKVF